MLLCTFKQSSHYTDKVPRYKGSQRDSRTEPRPPKDAPAHSYKTTPPRLSALQTTAVVFVLFLFVLLLLLCFFFLIFLLHVKPTQLLQSRTAWVRDILITVSHGLRALYLKNKNHNKCSAALSKAVSVAKVQLIAHAMFMAQQIRHWSRK